MQVADVALLPDAVLALHVEAASMPSCSCSTTPRDELQQQREEEVGHREAEVRERRGRVVERRVLAHRAHDADEQRQRSPTAPPRCRRAATSSTSPRRPCRRPGGRCGTSRPSRPARSRRASRTYCCGPRLVEVVLVARGSAIVCCETPGRCRNSRSGSPRAETSTNTTIVASSTTTGCRHAAAARRTRSPQISSRRILDRPRQAPASSAATACRSSPRCSR